MQNHIEKKQILM